MADEDQENGVWKYADNAKALHVHLHVCAARRRYWKKLWIKSMRENGCSAILAEIA